MYFKTFELTPNLVWLTVNMMAEFEEGGCIRLQGDGILTPGTNFFGLVRFMKDHPNR